MKKLISLDKALIVGWDSEYNTAEDHYVPISDQLYCLHCGKGYFLPPSQSCGRAPRYHGWSIPQIGNPTRHHTVAVSHCVQPERVLRPQNLPPGQHPLHQWPHAQLAGDSQRLVQQGHGLLPVAGLVTLQQGVGVVAAGPGKLGPKVGLAGEDPQNRKSFQETRQGGTNNTDGNFRVRKREENGLSRPQTYSSLPGPSQGRLG